MATAFWARHGRRRRPGGNHQWDRSPTCDRPGARRRRLLCAPVASDFGPVDPYRRALLYALVEEYAKAEAALGFTEEPSAAYLSLPVCANARGPYPLAVAPERDPRMRRLIALERVLSGRSGLQPHKDKLLDAVLAYDIPRLRTILRRTSASTSGASAVPKRVVPSPRRRGRGKWRAGSAQVVLRSARTGAKPPPAVRKFVVCPRYSRAANSSAWPW